VTDLADAASVAAAAIHHRRLRTPDLLRPGRSGLWVAFIGWFLGGAARAEEQLATARGILAGVRVRDAMTPNPVVAPASATVAQLLATSPPGRGSPPCRCWTTGGRWPGWSPCDACASCRRSGGPPPG